MGLQSRQAEMNQTQSARNARTICPVCNQEGRRITCTSGSKSVVIFYHPKNIFHNICQVADGGHDRKVEVVEEKVMKHDEANAS